MERFVYVWTRDPTGINIPKRTHLVRDTEQRPGTFRQVPVAFCAKRFGLYVTSPEPHPDLSICPRCKERAHA